MKTILDTLQSKHFIASEAQIESLASECYHAYPVLTQRGS